MFFKLRNWNNHPVNIARKTVCFKVLLWQLPNKENPTCMAAEKLASTSESYLAFTNQ